MAELSFSVHSIQVLEQIMEQLEADAACDDLDMDLVDGVLKIEFDDGAQIIVNRQEPLQQIWVASPLGPAHFSFDGEKKVWVDDKTGESLMATLGKACTLKLGTPVALQD